MVLRRVGASRFDWNNWLISADIHITSDNRLVMFHDPELHRTTNGTGRIDDQPWTGVLE
jgi:phosphatidylglycerol phospholipase C